jgi:hypothetical protein
LATIAAPLIHSDERRRTDKHGSSDVETIAVSIDGKPKFKWHRDEAKIAKITETYPEGAAREDLTPKELAAICVDRLVNHVAAHDFPASTRRLAGKAAGFWWWGCQ